MVNLQPCTASLSRTASSQPLHRTTTQPSPTFACIRSWICHYHDNPDLLFVGYCALQNLKDAASWLGYTYLYVRMLGSPQLYGVPLGALEDDLELEHHRLDLAHSAAVLLDKHNLIRYV